MTRYLILCLLLLATGLGAHSAILGIPVSSLMETFPARDLRSSILALDEAGYSILHYDAKYVIAVPPESPGTVFSNALMLSEYPPRQHLYLLNEPKFADAKKLRESGNILLELDSALLFASDLGSEELRGRSSSHFTELNLSPMRITASKILPPWTGEFRADVAQLVASVSADSILARIQHLQDFGTRYAYTNTRLPVAQWIQQQFFSYGISDVQLQQFSYNNYQQYNVVATLPGTEYPDQYIIIGGHHDSTSNDKYNFAPGADDNASGAAAVMEIARVMQQNNHQPKTSIRFITFACEELGLWGSYNDSAVTYAESLDVRLMINFDMIGNNEHDPSEWMVRQIPYDGSLNFTDYAIGITEQYTSLDSYADMGWYNSSRSDSYPYWQKGYNIVYFFEVDMDSGIYHTIYDVVDSLEIDYCTEVIKAGVACAAIFADLEELSSIPVAIPATNVGTESFTANWEALPGATGYWLDVYQTGDNGPASDLFFSEYLEGTGSNKALEIYNGTGSAVDLSDYRVEYFPDSYTVPCQSLDLSGELESGEVYVIANPGSFAAIRDRSDLLNSSVTSFDGDDHIALKKLSTGTYVDIFGRIGTDPGSYWGSGTLVTKDRTLVRKSNVTGGVTSNPVSGFPTLATEWVSYPVNSYHHLGSHSLETVVWVPGYEGLSAGLGTSYDVDGLSPGETYCYVVRADLGYGSFGNSNEISVTTGIAAPQPTLTRSANALLLSWPAVNGANTYRVEAADGPGDEYSLVTETTALELEIVSDEPRGFFRVTAIH